MDIASLGFKIDTSDVAKAERDLDSLAATGSKSEAAAKGAGNAWTEAGRKIGSGAGAAKQVAPAFNEGAKAIQAQQQALGKLLGQINPVIAALDRLDEQEKQLSGFKASGLLDTETFTEYQGRIAQARNGLTQFESSVKKTGVSSAQTAAALRQLPAQFTDIFTSLASGQAPLTVLLQQGGQIKDSFGGVGPALRETAKYAAALVNPYTVAAAAAVALAVAWKQGSDEAVAYNKALILTGNSAGTNADQMEIMARAIDGITGTQRQAAAALAEVASAGKFTADQLQGIALAAVAMEEATGKAVSDTVAEFKKLADEPAAASAKLNEQYNYLTAAVYEQIAALEAQGDAAGAAQLAIEAFGEAMQQRSQEIEGNLGLIERAWKGIKDGAAEAWDEMLGVGRPVTLEDQLAKLNQRGLDTGAVAASGLTLGPLGAIKELYDQIAPQVKAQTEEGQKQLDQKRTELELQIQQRDQESAWQAELARTNQTSISAQEELNKKLVASRTNAEKLKDEYAKIDKLVKDAAAGGVNYTDDQVAQLRAAAEKQYGEKTKKPARTPEYRDDAATRLLMSLREQEASLSAQLTTEANLTTEQKKRAEFEQQIADLKTKSVLTADQQSLLANQDSIRAQLDMNVAIAEEIRLRDASAKLSERQAQLQASMQGSQTNRREQYDRQLSAFGMGRQAQQQAEGAASIFREFRRYQDDLNKSTPKDLLGSEQYKQAREEIGQGLRDALAEHEAYYQRLEELQGSWQVGASQAFADFADQAGDIAGQTASIIGGVMEELTTGIADNLAQAMIYGDNLQESMQELANTILTEVLSALIEMGVRYGINSALEIAGITAVTGAKVAATTTETAAELAGVSTTTGAKVAAAATVATAETAAITATSEAAITATSAVAAAQVPAAAATTTAWAPAATVASIGSFGSAAAIGLAAVVAAIALAKGFRTGGYTGNGGVNDPAGIVHGQEFVFTAESVRRLGRGNLEALQAGRDIASASAPGRASGSSTAPAGSPTYITVNQPNVTDAREARSSSIATRRELGRLVANTQRAM
nr:phage tail tape measure protein [Pseudomonas sp. UBA6718]